MSDMDDAIVREFLAESHENLDQVDRDLVALEREPSSPERIARIFRAIHTIKGTCGFLGFTRLEAVAHGGESLLSALRDARRAVDPDAIAALLEMADRVRGIVVHIEDGADEGAADDGPLVARLLALASGGASAPDAAAVAEVMQPAPGPPPEPAPGVPVRLFDPLVAAGRLAPDEVERAEREQHLGDPRLIGEILVDHGALAPHEVLEALVEHRDLRLRPIEQVRVDVGVLDALMNLVGELVLGRNQLVQRLASGDRDAIPAAVQRVSLVTTRLQDEVMKTRMQPVGTLWNKLPRLVRDVAACCGKQVRLEMAGSGTDLDRSLFEALRDPLTHVVRNAVDHGIERPEDRRAAGKPAEGVLRLRAFHESGQVVIEVGDDGAGIEVERVRARALDRGLVTHERAARMSEAEWLDLLFAPGFSTAEQVTHISGRGVGLDVVRTNVERIGGTIEVVTRAGTGTTIRLRIPLTLAIVPALIVGAGGARYAIAQAYLSELVRVHPGERRARIERIHGVPLLRLRGALLPLVRLDELLGREPEPEPEPGGATTVVIVQAEGRTFGLIAAGVHDTQEIVVKPVTDEQKGLGAFAGVTVLGDGGVCLILDVPGLARLAGLAAGPAEAAAHVPLGTVRDPAGEGGRALVAEVGGTPVAIPLAGVLRLEEFPASSLEPLAGRRVVQCRNVLLPIHRVAELMGAGPADEAAPDPVPVIVHAGDGGVVGLAVDRIVDIVESPGGRDAADGPASHAGPAVMLGRATEVLDVPALLRATRAARAGAGDATGECR